MKRPSSAWLGPLDWTGPLGRGSAKPNEAWSDWANGFEMTTHHAVAAISEFARLGLLVAPEFSKNGEIFEGRSVLSRLLAGGDVAEQASHDFPAASLR